MLSSLEVPLTLYPLAGCLFVLVLWAVLVAVVLIAVDHLRELLP